MSTSEARTPTARELTAAKRARAATVESATVASTEAVVNAAPVAAQVPAVRQSTAVARKERNEEYRQRYFTEISPVSIAGRRIQWSKDATYVTSDDGEELPESAEYVFLGDQTLIGWIKFQGQGQPPLQESGLLYEGFTMPAREDLDEQDETKWELGLNGQPADPWKHQIGLVFQDTATQELYTFVTMSPTGRKACGDLLRHFDRMQRLTPGELPIVRLASGGFNHKDARVGFVKTPRFIVCGRTSRDSAAKPDTSTAAYLNDEITL
jgi:hypothetical protein